VYIKTALRTQTWLVLLSTRTTRLPLWWWWPLMLHVALYTVRSLVLLLFITVSDEHTSRKRLSHDKNSSQLYCCYSVIVTRHVLVGCVTRFNTRCISYPYLRLLIGRRLRVKLYKNYTACRNIIPWLYTFSSRFDKKDFCRSSASCSNISCSV
jgi:uncharacterized membrane protein YhaH (DUF805 family)